MLLQVVRKRLTYGLIHHTRHFRVAQFGLRLTLKLRLGYLY